MLQSRKADLGLSANKCLTDEILEAVDYFEIKKISAEEAEFNRARTNKPMLFHIQYTKYDEFYEPAVSEFTDDQVKEIISVFHLIQPRLVSLHFGLSSKGKLIDDKRNITIALTEPLQKGELIRTVENNLRKLSSKLPSTDILLENCEFIPEALCKGAYRHLSDADCITENTNRWYQVGILNGVVLDIAHALIAGANHPYYNGFFTDPLSTDESYISRLREKRNGVNILTHFQAYLEKMPISLIRELHISGVGMLENGVFVDAHNEIGELELEALKLVLELVKGKGTKHVYVTLEYNKEIPRIMPQLLILREHLSKYF
jgi:uncharacterized protein (UPF0276 family)